MFSLKLSGKEVQAIFSKKIRKSVKYICSKKDFEKKDLEFQSRILVLNRFRTLIQVIYILNRFEEVVQFVLKRFRISVQVICSKQI